MVFVYIYNAAQRLFAIMTVSDSSWQNSVSWVFVLEIKRLKTLYYLEVFFALSHFILLSQPSDTDVSCSWFETSMF